MQRPRLPRPASSSPQPREPIWDGARTSHFDYTTMHANNAGVTLFRACRIEIGFRRAVALLAVTAWTLSGFVCPMPDHGMGAVQAHDHALTSGGHVHQHGKSPRHTVGDLCCELLGHASAIAQPVSTRTPEKAPALLFAAAVVAVPSLTPEIDPTRRPIPPSNGPPRSPSQRFATFWSHAPPADLS
jgi:hypothetical protein